MCVEEKNVWGCAEIQSRNKRRRGGKALLRTHKEESLREAARLVRAGTKGRGEKTAGRAGTRGEERQERG